MLTTMRPEIRLTLVGQLGRWAPRVCADRPGSVWVSWLQHPAFGLIGLAVQPKAMLPATILPSQTWVRVVGLLRPLRVVARPADPRSERAGRQSLLLLHALSIVTTTPATPPAALPAYEARLGQGKWTGQGYLAPLRHMPDLFGWLPTAAPSGATLIWNRPYGVLTRLDGYRYLRYVLLPPTVGEGNG